MSDIHAIGIYKAAIVNTINVPEELAVPGFDNIDTAGWMMLSIISQHLTDSGKCRNKAPFRQNIRIDQNSEKGEPSGRAHRKSNNLALKLSNHLKNL